MQKQKQKEKENNTRYILLGLLSHENLSGYDIKKRIDLAISRFWPVGYAQIYPTLAQLEQEGFVTKIVEAGGKGPPRNVYTITETGRHYLHEWLSVSEEKEYVRYEILLKLFFGAGVPAQSNLARIEDFRERQETNLMQVRQFRKELEGILQESDDHLYYYLTVLFGEQIYTAYLNWAQQARILLSEWEQTKRKIKSDEEETQ